MNKVKNKSKRKIISVIKGCRNKFGITGNSNAVTLNLFQGLLIAMLFIAFSSIANAETIKGKVFGYDADRKSSPLRNARVVAVPSMKGGMTNAKGEFSFDITKNDSSLVITSAGYKADTILISAIENKLDIALQMQNIELEGVEATGSKVATQMNFTGGVKTETITSRGLHKAACCNLSESFTTTPSVDVQYTDAVTGAKRIQLLGLQSIYSQIQQQNIPIMRGLASNYGFSFVPGRWLEEIAISKGASNVKNGFESITGLINIAFKKPESEHPTTLELYMCGDVATHPGLSTLELNADHTINFDERNGTTFYLFGNLVNNEIDHNNDGFLDKPMGNQINFLNKWHTGAGIWHGKYDIQVMYDDRKGGQVSPGILELPVDLWQMRNKTQRYNLNVCNGFELNDAGANIGTILSFTSHKQEAYFGSRIFNGEQNSFYANIMYQLPFTPDHSDCVDDHHSKHSIFSNSTLTTGFSLQYDNYLELFDLFALPDYDGDYPTFKNDANVIIPGLFLEYAFDLSENFKVIAGLRGDYAKIKTVPLFTFDTVFNKVLLTPRLHLKYGLIPEKLVLAASAGKGHRVARELAENSAYLASNRGYRLNYIKYDRIDEAWNYGANMYYTFSLFGCPVDFNMDFYRTDFINQVIVDLDRCTCHVHLYSLEGSGGKSYSNAFQVDATLQPITNFYITAAYRMNDVKQTTADELRDKPLQSKHKSFLNFQYNTEMNEWAFDFTIDYNGSGRLPRDADKIIKRYDPFVLLNAKITREFKNFDIYIGADNITDYRIPNPIKGYQTPFSLGFDASMIYGPVAGICVYLGIRYKMY